MIRPSERLPGSFPGPAQWARIRITRKQARGVNPETCAKIEDRTCQVDPGEVCKEILLPIVRAALPGLDAETDRAVLLALAASDGDALTMAQLSRRCGHGDPRTTKRAMARLASAGLVDDMTVNAAAIEALGPGPAWTTTERPKRPAKARPAPVVDPWAEVDVKLAELNAAPPAVWSSRMALDAAVSAYLGRGLAPPPDDLAAALDAWRMATGRGENEAVEAGQRCLAIAQAKRTGVRNPMAYLAALIAADAKQRGGVGAADATHAGHPKWDRWKT